VLLFPTIVLALAVMPTAARADGRPPLTTPVATLAAARGAWQPAARLFTKAEALLKAEAAAFSLPARDHYERAHARARETLGEEDYQAAAAAGRALTVEQALMEAETLLEREHDGSAATTSAP